MVTSKGKPVTLEGNQARVGDPAPDFTALDAGFNPVRLSDFKGRVVILSSVPSIDTSVCAAQTRRFNIEARRAKAQVLIISMDLPFAQARFCEAERIRDLITVSDFKDGEFGQRYGLRVREVGLLARAVLVIDSQGRIVYREICEEMSKEPDYEAALEAARQAT